MKYVLGKASITLDNVASELSKEDISREMKKECVVGLLEVREAVDNQIKELVKDIMEGEEEKLEEVV